MMRRAVFALLLMPSLAGAAGPRGSGYDYRYGKHGSDREVEKSNTRSSKRPWLSFLSSSPGGDSGGGQAFVRSSLLSRIASGDEKVITFDRQGGAQQPGDASSRFVVITDHGSGKHVLGIPTVQGQTQPASIFDHKHLVASEVGAIFRTVLEADHKVMGRVMPSWRARVNLPDRISQDILHVHGDTGSSSGRGPLSGPTSTQGGFTLHEGKSLAATSSVATAKLGASEDELLGKMVMAVARLAETRGISDGSIEVARTDKDLTVRLVVGGSFHFGSGE